MKKKYLPLAFIILIALIVITFGFKNEKKATTNESSSGFAVVELFTSEGCSSCPPADETVARLLSKNIENVYILSYHVDYWNRLGWKDQFSSADYSRRQNQYASVFNLGSVYTPQVVVNGTVEFVGSDENKLTATVRNDLKTAPAQHISISATKSNNSASIHYNIDGNDVILLNIALVQSQATTSVKRGENGGRTLHHVNIVRELKTIMANGKGNVTLDIPAELSGMPLQIIAYTQDKKSLQILSADQKSLQ
jgi:hypothetical protein